MGILLQSLKFNQLQNWPVFFFALAKSDVHKMKSVLVSIRSVLFSSATYRRGRWWSKLEVLDAELTGQWYCCVPGGRKIVTQG